MCTPQKGLASKRGKIGVPSFSDFPSSPLHANSSQEYLDSKEALSKLAEQNLALIIFSIFHLCQKQQMSYG